VRTKLLAAEVAKHLVSQHNYSDDDADKAALDALAKAGIGGGKGKEKPTGELRYLLLFGEDLPAKIAQAVVDKKVTEDSVKELIGTAEKPLSLALFGRMIADDKSLSVDAACQVAHAISTHETASELDYYTAVDDLRIEDAGAGMLGEIGYQSAVLYRYANVNLDLLASNLNGSKPDAVDGVKKFVGSFVTSMPSGYNNSTAPGTLPNLVAIVIRDGHRPVSLADAFESPVPAEGGFMNPSAARLAVGYESVAGWVGAAPSVLAHRLTGDTATTVEKAFGPNHTLQELLDSIESKLDV
jgi:CRISPR system Cascade subunit CasC